MAPAKKGGDVSRRKFIAAGSQTAAAALLAGGVPQQMAAPAALSSCDEEPDPQYKRFGSRMIARLVDGKADEVIECASARMEGNPMDPEQHYLLALAYAQKNQLAQAANYLQRAIDAGMPVSRFRAGPREWTALLETTDTFRKLSGQQATALVHGPLLGSVTDRSARFWVRTAREAAVQVRIGTGAIEHTSEVVHTRSDKDYTAVLNVDNLEADTLYTYDIAVEGHVEERTWSFKTFPGQGAEARFDIGFGGCAGYTPWHERMWRTIASHRLPLFLFTGDNVYIDDPTRQAVHRYCYYRRQSRPEFRDFVASTSIAAIWDDHDFADDDSWGGPLVDEPSWKRPVWHTFRNNWNNPAYGGGEEQPGCWFKVSVADVDIFMLDDRYYRTDPSRTPATMLGPAQKRWLFDSLHSATGTFKLLVTSVPWAYGVKPGSKDPWEGYGEERDELFSFLARNRIEGVVLLSGDRHRADIWKIERPDGYALYDFENARLTNIHTHQVLPGALFGYNEKCTFGKLRFDTRKADPEVTYEIITIDNEPVHAFTVKRSQLLHG